MCFNDIIKITSRQEGLQMQFSNDFLWGAASASYQIEGAYLEDGKGENIWDAYCQESGHVAHGENGNVACDHYHRFKEDVALMKKIGLKAYRFAISWSRPLIPDEPPVRYIPLLTISCDISG